MRTIDHKNLARRARYHHRQIFEQAVIEAVAAAQNGAPEQQIETILRTSLVVR